MGSLRHVWLVVALLGIYSGKPAGCQTPAENLLSNPQLAESIEGWTAHEGTKLQWDRAAGKASVGCLLVPGAGGRQAAVQDIRVPQDTNCLNFSGWCHCEQVSGQTPMVALDLGVTLDNGELKWFVPVSAKLSRGAPEWQRLSGRYLAPEGRTIASVKLFCLNYRNSAPARFDDLTLHASQLTTQAAEITIIDAVTAETKKRQARLHAAAEQLGRPLALSGRLPAPDQCKLLIVPEWQNSDTFLEQIKTFYYCGGRIMLGWLPPGETGMAMWHWLFDGVTPGKIITDAGGTAVAWTDDYDPSPEQLTAAMQSLLAAEARLPEPPQFDRTWSAPELSFDRRAVYIDGKPRLFFAAGAYSVGAASTDPATDFAEFRDLGMNAVVLYVKSSYPIDELARVLDLAAEHGLVCLLYLQHGGGTHHPGRPWRAQWIAKFSTLSGHPAFLAWLTGDDVFGRHQQMMLRTAEIIRHYDKHSLICMTLMDLRRPERFEDPHWRRWDGAFDFPVPYVYTLQRGDGFGTPSAMIGGLLDLQRLGDNACRHFPDMPHFQWVQAHMQQNMWKKLGLTVEERWLPTPEQQALLVLHALAGGTDGLLYFTHRTITAAAGGLGRRYQLQVLHHQLKPVADILLLGDRRHLEVAGEAAATLFDTGRQAVILLRRVHDSDQAQVNIGSPVELRIKLPEKLRGNSFVRITPLGTQQLQAVSNGALVCSDFTGWEILATSSREADVTAWDAALNVDAPAIRLAIVEVLRDTYLKTKAVAQVLGKADLISDETRTLLDAFPSADTFLPEVNAPVAEFLALAQARRRLLGQAQQADLSNAARFWSARTDEPLPEAARTFYGLPYFYRQTGVELEYEPGTMGEFVASQSDP